MRDKQKEIFAKNLNHYLSINKLQQKEVANAIGVSVSTFNAWCQAQAMPRTGALQKLVDYFNVLTSELVDEHDFTKRKVQGIKIPVLGYVAAGIPIEEIEEILDYEEIDEKLAETGHFFGLRLRGNSMEPRMFEGDTVIVRSQNDVDSGSIAIVSIGDNEATCKKVLKSKNGIQLVSFNPSYNPVFFLNGEIHTIPVKIIGKVIELRAKL